MRSLRENKIPAKVVPGLQEIKIPKDVQAEILPIQFLVPLFKKKIPISSYLDQSKDQLYPIRVVVIREIIADRDKAAVIKEIADRDKAEAIREIVDRDKVAAIREIADRDKVAVIKGIADRDKVAAIKGIADQVNKLDLEIVLAEVVLEIVPVVRAAVRCRLLLRK